MFLKQHCRWTAGLHEILLRAKTPCRVGDISGHTRSMLLYSTQVVYQCLMVLGDH